VAKSSILKLSVGVLVTFGVTAIPLGLEIGGQITPTQASALVLSGIVALPVAGILWWLTKRFERIENYALSHNIPSLLADMDGRREQIVQRELDRRISSGNVNFVFNILWDMYAVLVGNGFPKLPSEMENKDIIEKLPFLMEYIPQAADAIKKLQDPMAKHGEIGTGLLMARSVNRYFPIENRIENDRRYKKLKKKLKTAREYLPSAIAPQATTAIDEYLDASRAYKTSAAVIVPLGRMLEEHELFRGVPTVAQIIDRFQAFRDGYSKIMNDKLAKVNEALGDWGKQKAK